MRKLLSLLSMGVIVSPCSLTTMSCDKKVVKFDISGLSKELSDGLNFTTGNDIDTVVTEDIQFLKPNDKNITTEVLESIDDGTLNISASDNTQNVNEIGSANEEINIMVDVTQKNKFFDSGSYHGIGITHEKSNGNGGIINLSDNLKLTIIPGIDMYNQIYSELAKLNPAITSEQIQNLKVNIKNEDGTKLTSPIARANTKYDISIISSDKNNTSSNTNPIYFTGKTDIQIKSEGKIDVSQINFSLSSSHTIKDSITSALGKLVNPNDSSFSIDDLLSNLKISIINNTETNIKTTVDDTVITGDNYTIAIDATNSLIFTNKISIGNLSYDYNKYDLTTLNLYNFNNKESFINQIYKQIVPEIKGDFNIDPNIINNNILKVNINYIDSNDSNTSVNPNTIPKSNENYKIEILPLNDGNKYFKNYSINEVTTTKYDLSQLDWTDDIFWQSNDLYNSVRQKLGRVIGIIDNNVAISIIKNDGVGIAIWDGNTLLKDGSKAIPGQTYTVKLVSGTSSYFTGDEKDITQTLNKYVTSNIEGSDFKIYVGDDIYNDIYSFLGSLVGVSAAEIEKDGINVEVYQGNNRTPLKHRAKAFEAENYIIAIDYENSKYFDYNYNDESTSYNVEAINKNSDKAYDISNVILKLNGGTDAFSQIIDQIGEMSEIPYSKVAENIDINILDENTNMYIPNNSQLLVSTGDTYSINVSTNSSAFTGEIENQKVIAS